jgi:hypothetical protein
LFAMFEGGGNIPLILPIVVALIERGHEVRVLAGPNVTATAGTAFRPLRAPDVRLGFRYSALHLINTTGSEGCLSSRAQRSTFRRTHCPENVRYVGSPA